MCSQCIINAKEGRFMEKTFHEYALSMADAVKPDKIANSTASVGRVGHFVKSEEGVLKPGFYPGFTLITPTSGDDTANAPLYKTLLKAQTVIKENVSPAKAVAAPEAALHMTVARLISGGDFEEKILGVRENELLNALKALFLNIPPQKSLLFEINGLAVMHGIVAAAVTTRDSDSYCRLQRFRDAVYGDKALVGFGVERKRGFSGHITLLYIEDELTDDEKTGLSQAVIDMNAAFFSTPQPFLISRGEVRRFDNYLNFSREKDWPVFNFGG